MIVRVIDLETTGTDPAEGAEIIEIAAVDVDLTPGGFRIVQSQSTLVKCAQPVPPETSAIHHIVDADLENAPTWEEVISNYGGAEIYCAHNAKFERLFLDPEKKSKRPWICTYKAALAIWPEAPSHSNQGLRYWRGHQSVEGWTREQLAQAHRALPDAVVTAALLMELAAISPVDDLIAISSQPALLPKIPFGKHAGTRWSELPEDYLEWMSRKGDWDEDVAFCLKTEIERRQRPEG